MAIQFFEEGIKLHLKSKKLIKDWIKSVTKTENFRCGKISIIFTNDDYLLGINKKFLKHDFYTDIITFDYTSGNLLSGDLFISIDRVKENALLLSQHFEFELMRIIIHGILHLMDYDDKTIAKKKIMTQKEDEYLSVLNLKDVIS
jgi:rRNA maturation RNase YbeY